MNLIWPIGTEIWFRTDKKSRRTEWTDGRSQNYIPPTSSGDNISRIARNRATDKDLGQLVFTTRFFSQIVFSGFLIVSISFFPTVHYLIFKTYWTLQLSLLDLICRSYDNSSAFQLFFCLSLCFQLPPYFSDSFMTLEIRSAGILLTTVFAVGSWRVTNPIMLWELVFGTFWFWMRPPLAVDILEVKAETETLILGYY